MLMSCFVAQLPSTVGLAAACYMLALLALMHFNQDFYERRRLAFSTLTRFIRFVSKLAPSSALFDLPSPLWLNFFVRGSLWTAYFN